MTSRKIAIIVISINVAAFPVIHKEIKLPQLKALKKRSKRMSSQREMSRDNCGGRHFEIRIR